MYPCRYELRGSSRIQDPARFGRVPKVPTASPGKFSLEVDWIKATVSEFFLPLSPSYYSECALILARGL